MTIHNLLHLDLQSSLVPREDRDDDRVLELTMSEVRLPPLSDCRNHSYFRVASTIPEEYPVRHRYSISSSDGNGTDLEASAASVRQAPHIQINTFPRGAGDGRSPKGRTRTLGTKINSMIDSLTSSISGDTVWTAKNDYALDTRILFKRKITALYISVSALKSYVEINYSGLRKILKK